MIMDGTMEHSNAIWNANLELQRQVKNKLRVYSYTIWNDLELQIFFKTRTVKGAFWWYLDSIGNCRENIENREAKWCILTAFETILSYRENKDAQWCIVAVFETISNFREKKWKQGH